MGDLIFARSAFNQFPASCKTNVTDIIMDTGSSSSVCSVVMVKTLFSEFADPLRSSKKTFKFGDSRSFASIGVIFVSSTLMMVGHHSFPAKQCVTLKFDVVSARIPCLLSRSALVKLNDTINFNTHRLDILMR